MQAQSFHGKVGGVGGWSKSWVGGEPIDDG